MVLKSVGVLSVGKVMGALGVVIGLIIGGFMALISMIGVAAQQAGNGIAQLPAMFVGVGAVIFMPIFYGVISFITGILYAAFYNLIAGMVGGLELELEPSAPGL
jgi:hypothetical protein